MGGKILNIGIWIQHRAVRLRDLLSQDTHLCEPQSIHLQRAIIRARQPAAGSSRPGGGAHVCRVPALGRVARGIHCVERRHLTPIETGQDIAGFRSGVPLELNSMQADHLKFRVGQVNQARDAGNELARFDRLCQVHLVTGEQRALSVFSACVCG